MPMKTLRVDDHEFREAVARLRRMMPGKVLGGLRVGEAIVIGEIKIAMAEPKHGRRYGYHVASAPGEAPAIDTGELAGSVQELGSASSAREVWVEYGSDVPQAAFTELGTSRMAPRPWLRSISYRKRGEVVAAFTAYLRQWFARV